MNALRSAATDRETRLWRKRKDAKELAPGCGVNLAVTGRGPGPWHRGQAQPPGGEQVRHTRVISERIYLHTSE